MLKSGKFVIIQNVTYNPHRPDYMAKRDKIKKTK